MSERWTEFRVGAGLRVNCGIEGDAIQYVEDQARLDPEMRPENSGWWSVSETSARFQREDERFYQCVKQTKAMKAAIHAFEMAVNRDKKHRIMSIIPFDYFERRKRMLAENKEVQAVTPAPVSDLEPVNPFSSVAHFEAAQRMARALSESTMIPDTYRKNIPNCLIALEISQRCRASVLMVMQNLYIVHGKPGWSAQYIISAINASGRFSPLRFKMDDVQKPTQCQAYAIELKTGEVLYGDNITMEMVKAEGWLDKKGSKWQTMPGQMFRYRAASFFGKVYAPEILMGLQTKEELDDVFTKATPVASQVLPTPSQAQITRLYTIASAAGLKHEEVHAMMGQLYGKGSSKELTIPEYDHLCEELLKIQQEKDLAQAAPVSPEAPVAQPELHPGDFGYQDERMVK